MKSRAAAKGRKLLFLAAVCLLPALLLSPTAEASRGVPAATLNLEPPIPQLAAEAPPAPQLDLFHLEDELLVEILTGVEPEHHQALLEHRRLELLPTSAIQKTASGVSTSRFELNVKERHALKPDLRWTVPFYAKARFYDPEVGRFLTEDPAEPDLTTPPSLHKYLYAYGNPTRYWDPFGLRPEEPEEDPSWVEKAWAWFKGFAGGDDLEDVGESGQEGLRAFDEQVYGRRGTGSSLEEEIARREEHRQGVAETTGIILENTEEAGTKLATAAIKAADAAGIAGVVKKGGRKLVSEVIDATDSQLAKRMDNAAASSAAKIDFGDIPSEHHWRYERYLEDSSKGNLGPDEWHAKAKQVWKNRKAGTEFEKNVLNALGVAEPKTPIGSSIPDLPVGLRFGVTDIKDVQELWVNDQSRGFYRHAEMYDLPFNIVISPRTSSISEPLLDQIRETGGRVFQFDATTGKFSSVKIPAFGYWHR